MFTALSIQVTLALKMFAVSGIEYFVAKVLVLFKVSLYLLHRTQC